MKDIPDSEFRIGRIIVIRSGSRDHECAGYRIEETTAKRVYVGELVCGREAIYLPGQGGRRKPSRPYVSKTDVLAVVDTVEKFNAVQMALNSYTREIGEINAERSERARRAGNQFVDELDRIGVAHNRSRP
jgi:hypothetical protein